MGCGDGVRRRAEEPRARSRYGHGRAGAMWLLWRLLWRRGAKKSRRAQGAATPRDSARASRVPWQTLASSSHPISTSHLHNHLHKSHIAPARP